MKKSIISLRIVLFIITIFYAGNLFSQMDEIYHPNIHSEGKLYIKDGSIYTDAIVVKFKSNVINLTSGIRYASLNSINPSFKSVKQIFSQLNTNSGPIKIVKQIPDAIWGDTQRINKVNGNVVQIHDFSQLFTIRFSKPVDLDLTINKFLSLTEIEFAHQPVSIIYLDEPNDPKYQNGSQWNLDVINAIGAWNVTHGNSTVKIGIVDDGCKQNHEDLLDKIIGGDGRIGDHGTYVAGVAGAATNNNKGVASLGWNIKLYTYGGYDHFGDESYAVQGINSAAANNTCFFITVF